MSDDYKDEVIDPGDRASALAKKIGFGSHKNCPAVIVVPHQPGSFRGAVGFSWLPHVLQQLAKTHFDMVNKLQWEMLEEVENDGAGGKPTFFALYNHPDAFAQLAWEIIAMTADDFARNGRLPCVIDNEINVRRITNSNFHLFEAMMNGFGAALAKANLVNVTGEIAVMKHNITWPFTSSSEDELVLTWGASCLGLAAKSLLLPRRNALTGDSLITPGQPIVGFAENGYRCNGGTFFINLIKELWGTDADKIRHNEQAMLFIRQLCLPSISYAKTICRAVGWQPNGESGFARVMINAIAHVTGGGVWGKFQEILPPGIGARLDNMPKPPPVLAQGQMLSLGKPWQLTDLQGYGTFHGGCGMLIICPDDNSASRLILEAEKDGIKAQIVGHTTDSSDNEILIHSKFLEDRVLSSKELPK